MEKQRIEKIFKLTPNIIDEIKLIENQDIPKYLFIDTI